MGLFLEFSRYVKAKSNREAEKLLANFIAEIEQGDFAKPAKVTYKQFAEKWLKDYAEIELAPKTVHRYRQLLESRIYKAIGDKKLNKIKPLTLVDFYNSLRKNNKYTNSIGKIVEAPALSESTIKHHHRLINAIFEKAIKWGVLQGTNPARYVDAPKVEKKKATCFDEKQVEGLLIALNNIMPEELKYKVATMIALMTGARLGEIMGLEWRDIGFANKAIEVR